MQLQLMYTIDSASAKPGGRALVVSVPVSLNQLREIRAMMRRLISSYAAVGEL
jgi:hypothetical protein